MSKKINGRLVFNLIALLVPIGFIVYFLMSERGFMDLIEKASKFNKSWLVIALACQGLMILVDAFVLYRLARSYDKTYTFKKAFKATGVGQFYSAITPAAVGGQPMQVFCMTKQGIDGGISSSCLLQKFLVYQTTITLYSLVALIFNLDLFYGELKGIMLTLALFGFLSHAVVVTFILIFSFNQKLSQSIIGFFFKLLSKIKIIKNPNDKIEKLKKQIHFFHESNAKLYKNKKLLFTTFILTIIQLTFMFAIPFTIYKTFNLNGANAFDMITAQAFVTMISSFMPLPGGSGAAEGSFYVFFKIFFMESTIKSAILVWRIITYLLVILVFAPFSNVNRAAKNSKGN